MFNNIAVVAPPGPDLNLIKGYFRNPVLYSVREFTSINEVNRDLGKYSFDILLIRHPCLDKNFMEAVPRLRARFQKPGIVILSPTVTSEIRILSNQIEKVVILHEPHELRDLNRVIEVISKNGFRKTRMHTRSNRSEVAEIYEPESGERVRVQLLDIAQMGAKVSLSALSTKRIFAKNRNVQLHYASRSEPGKIHRIETRIVWMEVFGGLVSSLINGPQQQMGLRFVAAL